MITKYVFFIGVVFTFLRICNTGDSYLDLLGHRAGFELKEGVVYNILMMWYNPYVLESGGSFFFEDGSVLKTSEYVMNRDGVVQKVTGPIFTKHDSIYILEGSRVFFYANECVAVRHTDVGVTLYRAPCDSAPVSPFNDPAYEIVPGKVFSLEDLCEHGWMRGKIPNIIFSTNKHVPLKDYTIKGKSFTRIDAKITSLGVVYAGYDQMFNPSACIRIMYRKTYPVIESAPCPDLKDTR